MNIYTRDGDDGTTSLSGGRRLSKHNSRIDAYGTVDELISWIGLLRDQKENSERQTILLYIQNVLMACASSLAADPENTDPTQIIPDLSCASILEKEIDEMQKRLEPLTTFILPGGNQVVSYCHIARCVCRRTERVVVALSKTESVQEIIIIFLNRLSDYLFVLARTISLSLDIKEVRWSL